MLECGASVPLEIEPLAAACRGVPTVGESSRDWTDPGGWPNYGGLHEEWLETTVETGATVGSARRGTRAWVRHCRLHGIAGLRTRLNAGQRDLLPTGKANTRRALAPSIERGSCIRWLNGLEYDAPTLELVD